MKLKKLNEKLAILGGEKEINFKFQKFNHIGKKKRKETKEGIRNFVSICWFFWDGILWWSKSKRICENCKDYLVLNMLLQ